MEGQLGLSHSQAIAQFADAQLLRSQQLDHLNSQGVRQGVKARSDNIWSDG